MAGLNGLTLERIALKLLAETNNPVIINKEKRWDSENYGETLYLMAHVSQLVTIGGTIQLQKKAQTGSVRKSSSDGKNGEDAADADWRKLYLLE